MKNIFKNIKQIKTTITGLLLAAPAILYAIQSGDWNDYVIEAIISGVVLVFMPDFFTKDERKQIKDNFKKSKKVIPIILLLILPFISQAQNNVTAKEIRADQIRGLYTGFKVDGSAADSTLNFLHTDYNPAISPKSILKVNDTTLREWIVSLFDLDTIGGSPGGLDGQFQYNNSGVFGGANGFIFDGINIIGSSGYIQHDNIRLDGSTITTPGSGNLTIDNSNVTFDGILSDPANLRLNSTLQPFNDNNIDIGTVARNWRTGYFGTDIEVRDSTLVQIIEAHSGGASSVGILGNVNVSNGSGDFNSSDFLISGSVISSTNTIDINSTNNNVTLQLSGSDALATRSSGVTIGAASSNTLLSNNIISSTASNDLFLEGDGTGNINFSGDKGVNAADPTNPQDVATKNYVDGLTSNSVGGTYTPASFTGVTNITSITGSDFSFHKIDSIVRVTGRLTVEFTSDSASSTFRVQIPQAGDIGLTCSLNNNASTGMGVAFSGMTTSNARMINLIASSAEFICFSPTETPSSTSYEIQFCYICND